MKNIAIIGSGSWGVALSIHLAKQGHNVKIWSFSQEECDMINNDIVLPIRHILRLGAFIWTDLES